MDSRWLPRSVDGALRDQAALRGVLARLWDLALEVILLIRRP